MCFPPIIPPFLKTGERWETDKGKIKGLIHRSKDLLISRSTLPEMLTLYRLGGSILLGHMISPDLFQLGNRINTTFNSMKVFTLPAFFLFVANYCNSVALKRIGIPLLYTSKCGIPFFVVLATLFTDGAEALPPPLALMSLLPIAVGISMASWNSPKFETVGFIAALISCIAQAALNVCSKRVIAKTHASGLEAQRAMTAVAFIIALLTTLGRILKDSSETEGEQNISRGIDMKSVHKPSNHLTIGAVVSYHFEYVLNFMFVKLVQPVTFSMCDGIRRLLIIVLGKFYFNDDGAFSVCNIIGITLALLGALGYSLSA